MSAHRRKVWGVEIKFLSLYLDMQVRLDGDVLGSWIGKPRKCVRVTGVYAILCKSQIPGGEKIKTIHLGCNRLIWLRYLFERREIGRAMTKQRSKYFVCH